MLSESEMKYLKMLVLTEFTQRCPYDTGELLNSISLEETGNGFNLTIDAPHTVYTEEEWISPRWGGKTNPNEKWIFTSFLESFNAIKSYYGSKELKDINDEEKPIPEEVRKYVEEKYE